MKVSYGLTLSSEEHDAPRLVEVAQLAEAAGFDFVAISDHYHPWLSAQGHSPFVWGVLGAVAARTERVEVGVGVSCPIMRIHPAIYAQAVATADALLGGRLVWGVGTGEALNEHIFGDHWPPHEERLGMLEEALTVIRRLWTEESVSHQGRFYWVEDARVFDPPRQDLPIIVSAFGARAAAKAAELGDGLWITGAAGDTIELYRKAGGEGPVYSQLTLSWAEDQAEAIATAHELWSFSSLPGQLNQDLPTIAHFEQAVELVTHEQVAADMPCGPNPEPILEAAQKAIEAGVDHLYFHQVGPDQEGFIEFWKAELAKPLAELEAA